MPAARAAVQVLLRGYEEQVNLYTAIRDLTLAQRFFLDSETNLSRFSDLIGEKEDLLGIIARLEREMKRAKEIVLSLEPGSCPHGRQLSALLDRVTQLIEETRALEQENLDRLEAPVAV